MTQAIPLFDEKLGRGLPSGDGEFRHFCPFCPAPMGGPRERTLSVNYLRGVFCCFRGSCGMRGGLPYLARRLGFEYGEQLRVTSLDQLRARLYGAAPQNNAIPEPVELPQGLRQIVPGMQAWDYLIQRGLTPEDIYYNELCLADEDRGRRIYFLQRDENNRIIYWVGRKYLPGTRGPKYRNPGTSVKRHLLYRSHLIDRNYPVSVCEGPISAIVAGNAVATLGVLFSKEQVQGIARLGCPILSAMDGEAFTYSLKLARAIEPYGATVKVVPLPHSRDPADVGRAAYLQFAAQAFGLEPGCVTDMKERMERLR